MHTLSNSIVGHDAIQPIVIVAKVTYCICEAGQVVIVHTISTYDVVGLTALY